MFSLLYQIYSLNANFHIHRIHCTGLMSWFFIPDVIDFGMRSMQVIVFWESDDEKGADYGDAQGLL